MATSPKYSLQLLDEGAGGGATIFSQAVFRMEGFASICAVEVFDDNSPPAHVDGNMYHIGGAPTGDWASNAGDIAMSENSGWVFFSPYEGLFVWDKTNNDLRIYDGAAWQGGVTIATAVTSPSASYTQSEMVDIYDQLNALIVELRTLGIINA